VPQPPSAPRRHRPVAGATARAVGAGRARTGGGVAGTAYALSSLAEAGAGARFAYRDYSGVEPRSLRESYEWWQQICSSPPARGWAQARGCSPYLGTGLPFSS
jgi:hypothetical protein